MGGAGKLIFAICGCGPPLALSCTTSVTPPSLAGWPGSAAPQERTATREIWTLTINDDNGSPSPVAFNTLDAANTDAKAWVEARWIAWFGKDAAPCPEKWREAMDILSDQVGFMDSISMCEHDLSDHPAVTRARELILVAQSRFQALPVWARPPQLMADMRRFLAGEA